MKAIRRPSQPNFDSHDVPAGTGGHPWLAGIRRERCTGSPNFDNVTFEVEM
jgi:hypothetical protein